MNRHVSKTLFDNQIKLTAALAQQNPNLIVSVKIPLSVPKTQWAKVNLPKLDEVQTQQDWSWFDGFQLYPTEKASFDREFSLEVKDSVEYPSAMDATTFVDSLVFIKKSASESSSAKSSSASSVSDQQN